MKKADAIDLPNSWWNTGPEAGARWFGQDLITHDSTDAMRSPPTPPGGVCTLTTTIEGPCTLRWWWHIPAGTAGDGCSFVLDGTSVLTAITGETAWGEGSGFIPEGLHDVAWRWRRDTTGDPSAESAIVDQVGFTP